MQSHQTPLEEEGFEVLVPSSARRASRRVQLVVLGIVVLVAAVIGIRWLTHSDPPVRITAYGQPVADPAGVLAAAQKQFESYVAAGHGNLGADAKCWFQRPPGSSDITSALLCGPVQFYDDDDSTPYLRYTLIAHGSGNPITVETAPRPTTPSLVAAASGTTLVRPGQTAAPLLSAGIPAPIPPAADPDTLTMTDAVQPAELEQAASTAMIGGDTVSLRLDTYGAIDRFGRGLAERSTPAGMQLFAFRIIFGGGENGFAPLGRLTVGVAVGTAAPRPLHLSDTDVSHSGQLFVVATPPTVPLWLVLTEHGVTQRLSLRDGSPEQGNVVYLQSARHVDVEPASRLLSATLTTDGVPSDIRLFVAFDHADMLFFVPGTGTHPTRPDHVFLFLNLYYVPDGHTGRAFVDTSDVTLTPRGGTPIHPRHVDGSPSPVFEVPVDISDATITVSGTVTTPDYTLTIPDPVQLNVHLVPDGD